MAEPTAEYRVFSWIRQGLLAGAGGTPSTEAARLIVPVRVRVNEARDFEVPLTLHGPADVTGVDRREIIRTDPQHLATDFEPNYFPIVEFDRPDFPWLFTPAAPDTARRLYPWICLVVVRRNTATLKPGGGGSTLPVLDCPRGELPDLADAWAWAHAQIVAGGSTLPEPVEADAVADVLRSRPERTLSRLVGARRLDPATAYVACLVPTHAVGRKAGLGEPIASEDEQANARAWPAATPDTADVRERLPVYFHWEFTTGAAGDFESIARRLVPRQMPDTVGLRQIDVSRPGWGMPQTDPDAPGSRLDLGGALQTTETVAAPWPAQPRQRFQAALRRILNVAAQPDPSGEPAVLAPPLYGQWYADEQAVPAGDAAPHWFRELNLDPRARVAAGLGTLVVRFEQEQLMASAWDQLARQRQENERRQRAQLAESVGELLVDKHFKGLRADRFLRLTAPVRTRIDRTLGASSQRLAAARSAAPAPALTASYRRLTRSSGPIAKRFERAAGTAPDPVSTGLGHERIRSGSRRSPHATTRLTAIADQTRAARMAMLAQLDPSRAVLRALQDETPEATSTDLIRFAPQFPQPMYEPLRDYFQGMLLPGIDRVPPNTIGLLETNQPFIEAYMVGLNHEMSRELLWRGYPTDRRATYFRQFWDVRGRTGRPTAEERDALADIHAIASWGDDGHLGDHAVRVAAEGQLVLLVRGDLFSRFPRAMVYAVEAVWSDDGTRREIGTNEQYPMFRATQAPDITMLGFQLTESQVRGADSSANHGHAGWHFMLQEQPTEPRFGLDVPTSFGGTPQRWRDVTWGHMAPDRAALEGITYLPLDGLLKDVTLDGVAWGRNSAQMASITRQRPFRVAVHARTWLSGGG